MKKLYFFPVALVLVAAGCTTTTMSEAEQDALLAQCQLITDDRERAECLERVALGDQGEPIEYNEPVQY